jgi:hypothetical protein
VKSASNAQAANRSERLFEQMANNWRRIRWRGRAGSCWFTRIPSTVALLMAAAGRHLSHPAPWHGLSCMWLENPLMTHTIDAVTVWCCQLSHCPRKPIVSMQAVQERFVRFCMLHRDGPTYWLAHLPRKLLGAARTSMHLTALLDALASCTTLTSWCVCAARQPCWLPACRRCRLPRI